MGRWGVRLLCGGSAVWALAGCGAERQVFAHYMVCIPTFGARSGLAEYQEEIRAAQAAGIDGFALNCGGWSVREPHYKRRAQLIYQAAKDLGTGFKLLISADYATGLTSEETRDMVESFRGHPNQFRLDGKPVLSTFGGGRAQREFVARTFTGTNAIVYVPFYYPVPAAEMPNREQAAQVFRDHPGLDGFFHFGAAGTPEQIVESNRLLASVWLGGGKIFMAGITPYYRGLGGNYRVYESRGFEGYVRQWEGAIRDRATWVELVTWNDWGEASYLAPFGPPAETRHWNGHWGEMLSHEAFLRLSRYYIAWYKRGTPPPIRVDTLYYAYRTHPKTAAGRLQPREAASATGYPAHAETLFDSVFVTLFLAAPARLTITSGEYSQAFSFDTGVRHVGMPFVPGRQRFALTRGEKTIIDKTGELEISADDTGGNFNLFAGWAEAPTP
ncbi:MAG: endo-1,3-alpha-glucanase family glycosylhydrolase [Kiritimatiellia bacterium]|nr:endo-1,3-alpha-glucanase family glycosylhydrolase [Kiritimatiellia bacterium]